MNAGRRILVTGGSGFFGDAIVRAAQQAGYRVVSLDRQRGAAREGVDTVVGDISNVAFLQKSLKGVSAVIHAAGLAHVFGRDARRTDLFDAVNERGTDNVLNAALLAGVQKIVLVSSVSVYGHNGGWPCDEAMLCSPHGAYAQSKWRAELRAMERVGNGPASLTILRFATLYGAGDRGNVARLIQALKRGRFVWPGAGLNSKSLIHKRDAAKACVLALNDPCPGVSIFNVSTDAVTMREIVDAICLSLEKSAPRLRLPGWAVRCGLSICRRVNRAGQVTAMLQKFIHDDVYSGEKFENAFGFRASISLREGIREEVTALYGSRKRVRALQNEQSMNEDA